MVTAFLTECVCVCATMRLFVTQHVSFSLAQLLGAVDRRVFVPAIPHSTGARGGSILRGLVLAHGDYTFQMNFVFSASLCACFGAHLPACALALLDCSQTWQSRCQRPHPSLGSWWRQRQWTELQASCTSGDLMCKNTVLALTVQNADH